MPKKQTIERACDSDFLKELHEKILRGITSAELITPEKVASTQNYLVREVLYGERPRVGTYCG